MFHGKAKAVSEEFTDFILVDNERSSMLLNIENDYYDIILNELERMGFTLVFKTSFKNNSSTCAFVLS